MAAIASDDGQERTPAFDGIVAAGPQAPEISATVRSEIAKPSFSSSPWIFGAPSPILNRHATDTSPNLFAHLRRPHAAGIASASAGETAPDAMRPPSPRSPLRPLFGAFPGWSDVWSS